MAGFTVASMAAQRLAEEPTVTNPWPEAVVAVAFIFLVGFVLWVIMR